MEHEEHKIEKILHAARRVSLSHVEKEEMKRALRVFMAENPLRTQAYSFSARSFMYRISTHPLIAAIVLVSTLGVGTSYAAQTALPGDRLYPVKVGVNEPLAGILKTSDAEKAQWNASLATRRLEEAEILIARGKMSSAAQQEINANLEERTVRFNNAIESMRRNIHDAARVADAQSGLEVSLNAHARVLADMEERSPENVAPILEKVRAHADDLAHQRGETEDALSSQANDSIKTIATERKHVAEEKIKSNRSRRAVLPVVSARATVEVEAAPVPGTSTREMERGDQRLNEGRYGEAYVAFQAAIRDADESKIVDDTRERLKHEQSDGKD